MANNEVESAGRFISHLEAQEGREIVFCHMCESQWWRDEHGLVCPACEGEITEIVSAGSDPRPRQRMPTPPEVSNLRQHYPFHPYADDSDPEEADIDEHVRHTPDGYTFSRTTHSHTPFREAQNRRRGMPEEDVMGNFQNMIANMMGPQFGQPPQHTQGGQTRSGMHTFTFGTGSGGPNASGTRWTFSSGGPDRGFEHHSGEGFPDVGSMFGGMFGGPIGPNPHQGDNAHQGMPPALAGLFASLLNPANARSGDAVYTQEALDNIISQLMEQNSSNAPGPAPEDAINALPKKKLDEKMLGPEGKGECSVCMDDVTLGDEVVQLPCSHWFHQQCASIWLKEHNTCPICRKGIDGSSSEGTGAGAGAGSSRGQSQSQNSPLRSTVRRLSQINRLTSSTATGTSSSTTDARGMESIPMNAAARSADLERRLESIRETGGRDTGGDDVPRTTSIIRIQLVGGGNSQPPITSRRSSRVERPREERRDSERSHGSSRRESRQSSRRTSTQSSANSSNVGGLASSAVGWLRNQFTGSGSSSNGRRRE